MTSYQIRNVFLLYQVKMTLHMLLHAIKRFHWFISLLQQQTGIDMLEICYFIQPARLDLVALQPD